MKTPTTLAVLAIILGATASSQAQPNSQGAVELSNSVKVPQNPSLPKLNLTNTQREQIRETVLTEHNEVLARMPELRDYMYVKMKDQVLIVNGLTNEIVDMFSETQPIR